MCGFLGIMWKNKENISNKVFESLLQTQAHRGPDENSCTFLDKCWLGHNRLSIVDLKSSRQPMSSKCGKCTIVYNGEIYNYKELGTFLLANNIDFDQGSDTSILLHGFLAFGEKFLDKINGMFSFVIYNSESQSVTLARDRLGKKPLFYANTDYGLIFSSNLKSISRSGLVNNIVSQEAVYLFLKYGFIPEEKCIYSSIKKVKSAEIVTYDATQLKKKIYWKLPSKVTYQKNEKFISKIESVIKSAIEMRILQSDVEVASFLSGGVDSSGVTCLAANMMKDKKIKAFHIVPDNEEYDESNWAKKVADSSKTNLLIEHLENEETGDLMGLLVDFMDEPLGDSSALPTFQVCKLSSKYVKVAVSGEGGDELFLGYDWQQKFIKTHYLRQLSRFLLLKIKSPLCILNTKWRRLSVLMNLIFLRDEDAYEFLYSGGNKELLFTVLNAKFKKTIETLDTDLVSSKMRSFKGSIFQKILNVDLKHYLAGDLLVKVDTMSMANSLEVRSPLLDYRLIELSASIPDYKKLLFNRKYYLKKALVGIIPAEILRRKDKRGFSVNKSKKLNPKLISKLHELLNKNVDFFSNYFDMNIISSLLKKKSLNTFEYDLIWNLLVLNLWLESNERT